MCIRDSPRTCLHAVGVTTRDGSVRLAAAELGSALHDCVGPAALSRTPRAGRGSWRRADPVSYTHLTLPTSDLV